jgi:hypothetical protein
LGFFSVVWTYKYLDIHNGSYPSAFFILVYPELRSFDLKMRFHPLIVAAMAFVSTGNAHTEEDLTGAAPVEAARETAKTLSPTSSVKGKNFNRFVNIWLENTDFDMAAGDGMLTLSRD